MRLTIGRKLAAGLAFLSCLGILAMLVVYRGLTTVEEAMRHLSELREPASTASHEMEINLNEIGLAVLKYLDSADQQSRDRVAGDEAEFERFLGRYLELVETEHEQRLGAELGRLFGEFTTLAHALIAAKDEQERAFRTAGENFESLDAVIDENLDRLDDRASREQWRKLFLSVDLEADLAEVGLWLANYQRTHRPEHRALIEVNEREFRDSLARLTAVALTSNERDWVRSVQTIFDETMTLVRRVAEVEDYLRDEGGRFDRLRETMDDILDDQVQATAYQGLVTPREQADRATHRVVRALQVMIPGFVLAALAVGIVLVEMIRQPLARLVRGTAAIGDGNLQYRVTGLADDEFGDLADRFNRMVERLETTTVSKERLEASEGRLRATVDDLRREIGERRRAEAEGARLQEKLRRSETMSAMGSLVAGVAHEVRNPLFGISSTLDALEARLGVREEIRPHIAVLRGEVDRLSQLMRDLLNYGRPAGGARVAEPIHGAIAEALTSCATLARNVDVAIETRYADGGAAVAIDRSAMAQVFRNLLENAIQHSPPGGTVTVETDIGHEHGRAWLDCAVADGGAGFRGEDLGRVFDPFFTRRRGGTGLGLSIVQRIVDDHDGRVHATNRDGGGAVVTVRLPLVERATGTG